MARTDCSPGDGPDASTGVPLAAPASARMSRSVIAGVGGVLVSFVAIFAIIQIVGPERLQELVQASGPFAPVVFVLLKASTLVIAPISGTPLRFAAGAMFGFWEGVALSVCGSVLGGSTNFWIARLFGRRIVVRLLGAGALARVEPLLGRLGNWRALILARLVLAPLWDLISYGVGLTRLRFRTYVTVAFFGDLLPTALLVGAGAGLMELELHHAGRAAVDWAADLPVMVLVVAAFVGIALLLVGAAYLRPRVLRLLSGPLPRRRTAPRRGAVDA